MAATSSGALKALLEGAGLGIGFYRDQAPGGQALPYGTINERVSVTKSLNGRGDFGDPNAATVVEELVDVHFWQQWRNPATGAVAENYTLVEDAVNILDGAVLAQAPKLTNGVRLASWQRFHEADENVIHDVVSVVLHRFL